MHDDALNETPATRPGKLGKDQGFRFAAARGKDLPVLKGRRHWMDYLDYGVTEATSGQMRAQRIIVTGKTQGTDWHYHVCEMQFFYVIKGYIVFHLEDGSTLRLEAGDTGFIPGGYKHAEIDISEDFDTLEVSVPADLGTVPCDPPEAWKKQGAA